MSNRTYHERNKPVHGYSVREHPLYYTWAGMLSRCFGETNSLYCNYGARGITVDPRWFHFENFAVDMWPKPDGDYSIDRIDNNSGYSKENCRWATGSVQCFNRRVFKNNTSGHTGVIIHSSGFEARFNFEGVRYAIGRYDTAHDAVVARAEFISLFFCDRDVAIESISGETLWRTSTTKERGVTCHTDGGYIVRVTIAKVRHYVGYYNSIEDARNARDRFIASATR